MTKLEGASNSNILMFSLIRATQMMRLMYMYYVERC